MVLGAAIWVSTLHLWIQLKLKFKVNFNEFCAIYFKPPGLLQRKRALVYFKPGNDVKWPMTRQPKYKQINYNLFIYKPEAPIVQATWLKTSMPVLTEHFVILTNINPQEEQQEYNLMQNLNFGFKITGMFLSGYIFSILFIFFLNRMKRYIDKVLTNPKFSLKRVVFSFLNVTDQVYNISPSISIFILMVDLYLWLIMLMVCNTIKTDKVVIDTSSIILNVEDALRTPRTFCLIEDDTEFKVLSKNIDCFKF